MIGTFVFIEFFSLNVVAADDGGIIFVRLFVVPTFSPFGKSPIIAPLLFDLAANLLSVFPRKATGIRQRKAPCPVVGICV